jgi:hypothetical protein
MAASRSIVRFGWVGQKPEAVSIRAWREALKAGWFAVGEYYDKVVQPRKFEPGAATKYGFRPRTERYLKRKERTAAVSWRVKDGGKLSLVFGGVTRTAVLRTQYPKPYYNRVVVDTPTPDYVQMRPKKANRPNLGEELSSLAPDERAEMEKIFQAVVEARIQEYSGGRRK